MTSFAMVSTGKLAASGPLRRRASLRVRRAAGCQLRESPVPASCELSAMRAVPATGSRTPTPRPQHPEFPLEESATRPDFVPLHGSIAVDKEGTCGYVLSEIDDPAALRSHGLQAARTGKMAMQTRPANQKDAGGGPARPGCAASQPGRSGGTGRSHSDQDETPGHGTPSPKEGAGMPGIRNARFRHILVSAGACAALAVLIAVPAGHATGQEGHGVGPGLDTTAVMGPGECAECHKSSSAAWKQSLHHTLIKKTHRTKEGRQFASRLGVKRIKDPEGLCAACHYTPQVAGTRLRIKQGVTCESCHGAGRDWIKIHSEFSGKKEQDETPEEEANRWIQAEDAGMIRPGNLFAIAGNCASCHAIAHEDLVDIGGHPVGSAFEMLTWTMGEVRHNVWYTPENNEATAERRRMLYLAGLALTLETSLNALSEVRNPDGKYAADMRERAGRAAARLGQAADLLADVPELREIAGAALATATDREELRASAAAVAGHAKLLLARDGSGMDGIDPLLPGSADYVGAVPTP